MTPQKWFLSADKILLLLAGMVLPAHGGPWVQERAHGLLIFSLNRYQATERFSVNGGSEPLGTGTRFSSLTPQLWLEVGVTDNLTGIVSFSVPRQLYVAPAYRAHSTAPGDVLVGMRRAVRRSEGGWQLAVQGLLKAPTYSSRVEPRPGNGQTDVELSFVVGRSVPVGPRWGFVSGEGGYRFRWGRPADQWRGEVAGGLHASRRLTLIGQVFLVRSVGAFPNFSPEANPQIEPWFQLARIQPSVVIRVNQALRLQAGWGADVAGRNVGRGQHWVMALWTSF